MSFTIVQHAQSPSGGTVTLAATGAGNTIIVAVSNDGAVASDPTTITLTGSADTFVKDVNAANTNPTANVNLSVWRDSNCSAGKTSVVASGGLGSGVLMDVWEIAGMDTTSPVAGSHGAGAPASTLQAAFDSGATASIPAGCLGIAAVTGIGSGGRAQASVSGTGTWTTETALQPGSVTQMLSARQNTLAAGTPHYQGTFSAPVAGAYWAAVVVAYKPLAVTVSGSASLSAPATLGAAALDTVPGVAHLSSSPSLTAAGKATELAVAHLAASPAATAAGVVTRRGSASLAAPGALTAAGSRLILAVAHLAAAASLGAQGMVTAVAQAHLSASPAVTAKPVGDAPLAASPLLIVTALETAHGASALSAAAVMAVSALPGANTEALWNAYLAAYGIASQKWQQWRMMRQAGGTDGTAGFLFGQAYEAQAAAELAYEAWRLARQQAFPGVTG